MPRFSRHTTAVGARGGAPRVSDARMRHGVPTPALGCGALLVARARSRWPAAGGQAAPPSAPQAAVASVTVGGGGGRAGGGLDPSLWAAVAPLFAPSPAISAPTGLSVLPGRLHTTCGQSWRVGPTQLRSPQSYRVSVGGQCLGVLQRVGRHVSIGVARGREAGGGALDDAVSGLHAHCACCGEAVWVEGRLLPGVLLR